MQFLAQSLLCCVGAIALWSLVSAKLASWKVVPPLAIAVCGALIGWFIRPEIATVLNYHATEQIAELVLATLLFSDAIAVRGKMLGVAPSVSLRLLLVALPLSLIVTAVVVWLVMPGLAVAVALLVACIVMPSDMAPAAAILTDNRLSLAVRSALNVEAGYNDGIVAPVFVFALALVAAASIDGVAASVGKALFASTISLAVGLVVGMAYGQLMKIAIRQNWATDRSVTIGVLTVPLVAFSVALLCNGNGFVAAFVAGVAIHVCTRPETERYVELTKQIVEVTSLVVWFVFGVVAAYIVYQGLDWRILVVSALALTVTRTFPVCLALLGSRSRGVERAAISILAPRGITTIVLGLLAFNAIADDSTAVLVLEAMTVTVSLSLVLHGIGSSPIATLLAERLYGPRKTT